MHPARVAISAAAVAGSALWFSRGALDVVGTLSTQRRVALLPSWPELLGFVILALLTVTASALMRQQARRTRAGGRSLGWDPILADALRPLFGLGILALPYLPWLPDWIPVMRLLAGPIRWLLWGVVLGEVAWILLSRAAAVPTGAGNRIVGRRMAPLAVFVVSLAVYAAASARLMEAGYFPGGDEPHYLIITQSLLRDHDLKIENNYARRDYSEYVSAPLTPDFRRGVDGEIYSVHPIGLPVLAMPAFAIAGYRGVVWLLVLLAAGTATLMWRWALRLTGSAGAATFAWAAVCLTAPFVINSFGVSPEIPAAFCVMLAAGVLGPNTSPRDESAWPRLSLAALAIAMLPWLSIKYAAMAVVLAGLLAWRSRRLAIAGLVLFPLAVSLVGWLSFFYLTWGAPWPGAPYHPNHQINVFTFVSGGPGLLFDQEYGVCAYAPVLVLGLAGLAGMWRDRSMRRVSVELTIVGFALLALVGSFALWWGGLAMPGRPIVSMLPLFGIPIAWSYRRAAEHAMRRAAFQLLLLVSLGIAVTLVVAVNGVLVAQGRDGSSSLLEWLSPAWPLWGAAPTYILGGPVAAGAQSLVWLGGAALIGWLCRRSPMTAPGRAALRVTLTTAVVCIVIVDIAPILTGAGREPRFDPEARVSIPMLNTFDATARPLAVRYDPFSIISPSVIPPLFSLTAVPGARLARQPLRVLLNARFRLPAGEYELDLRESNVPDDQRQGTIGLQIGREGNPVEAWPFAVSGDRLWRQNFRLPLDAEFVAFRATPQIETTITSLRLTPVRVVDAASRLRTGAIVSTASFGSMLAFFHDTDAYIEPAGFWVKGQARLRVTLMKPEAATDPFMLNLHSGARANRVTLATPYWSERFDLVPNVTRTIVVPARARDRLMPLEIRTSSGFVPAEIEPGSSDRRRLGCWVAFGQ